ncbi:MAG: hypothetical protein ABL886_01970 [Rhodoglobus sp.]
MVDTETCSLMQTKEAYAMHGVLPVLGSWMDQARRWVHVAGVIEAEVGVNVAKVEAQMKARATKGEC